MGTKMAIVGMEIFWGSCPGLDTFEQHIYAPQDFAPNQSRTTEKQRSQKTLHHHKAPFQATLQSFEIDAFYFKIPPINLDKLDPQQLLTLKVADNALRNANWKQNKNLSKKVAIISYCASASRSAVSQQSGAIANCQLNHQENNQKNFIANKIATLWNISDLSFTLLSEKSVYEALEKAQILLTTAGIDTVLVSATNLMPFSYVPTHDEEVRTEIDQFPSSKGCHTKSLMFDRGAGAVVLKLYERAKQDQDRVYAVIDAVNVTRQDFSLTAELAKQSCQQAFEQAEVKSTDIGYLEIEGNRIEQNYEAEIQGLVQAYQVSESQLNCAMGSINTPGITTDMASLIKTALCLYHRYIPAIPPGLQIAKPEALQASPFYLVNKSRPWFLAEGQIKRVAAINSSTEDGAYIHLILSEDLNQKVRNNGCLKQASPYLFAIAAEDQSALLEQLTTLRKTIESSTSLAEAANQVLSHFQQLSHLPYALALIGRHQGELIREIERAQVGVVSAFAQGQSWRSPSGSYFTPQPLSKQGTVAFVYPGAFNSYIGMAQRLFHLFPSCYDRCTSLTSNPGRFLWEKLLYPRSQHSLSKQDLEGLESQLLNTPLSLLETGTGFAVLLTHILKDHFQVQPQVAMGYSMGESTMLYALDVWSNTDYGSHFVHSSELFRTRLAGPQNTVLEHWGIPPDHNYQNETVWSSYVLICSASVVKEHLKQEERVYLTHVNTPTEVVIAGDRQDCQRVIEALQCDAFRTPSNLVLHCEAMKSEYQEFIKLNTLPLETTSEIAFYSSASYAPIPLQPKLIAHHLAQGICQELDFPRLINRVYADGARIFIELGSGGTCSRWISENLKQQDHVALCINRRGADDHTTILQALAQLVSHRVSLDLSPLYEPALRTSTQNRALIKTIRSNPQQLTSTSTIENREHYTKLDSLISTSLISSLVSTSNTHQNPSQQLSFVNTEPTSSKTPVFDLMDILEFTEGKVSQVFGKEYEAIDSYTRRVRLPSPPYLFMSRVTQLKGKRGDYKSGFIQTEYDVPPDAWYSIDGQIPSGICQEAGHGILLLLSYLGSDFENQGQRSFRLLDLAVTCLDEQPEAVKTLRYDISINSHVKTTNSLLIFFSGECWINDKVWMQLHGGCAGLFSDEELAQGQGIIISEEKQAKNEVQTQSFQPLLFCQKASFDQADLLNLTQGNIVGCFGKTYQQQGLNPSLRLPPQKLMMIDQVTSVEPTGGKARLGLVTAEKFVEPEDWYFLCHFKNDPTMPGSLIIEGSIQLLQFYLLFLGLQTCTVDARFQSIPHRPQTSRFRGQVTPTSGILTYRMEVTEIGTSPQPFAVVNVNILFAGKTIATVKSLGLQLSEKPSRTLLDQSSSAHSAILFGPAEIKEFAQGSVASCLGAEYQIYQNRRSVRLPNHDFCMMSRVLQVQGKRYELQRSPSITTEYDVSPTAWFYRHNSYPDLPYCTYIEMAGQPCIFLGVYLGITLLFPEEDLYFRNLDGQGTILKDIDVRGKTITDQVQLVSSTTAIAGAIIQKFDFQLFCDGEAFYQGDMVFGYFSHQVLTNQVGLDGGKKVRPWHEENNAFDLPKIKVDLKDPTHQQKFYWVQPNRKHYRLAHDQLNFLDEVLIIEAGGYHQQGYIYASKIISPDDWYFSRHFYQDPVMPGALGIEAILQAMKVYALQLDLGKQFKSPRFAQVLNHQIAWKYRGQITPENREMYLETHISAIDQKRGQVSIFGDASLWKGNMRIYEVKGVAICLVES